jgi:transposase
MEGEKMEKQGRYYTEEFKLQIVKLKEIGRSTGELSREYGVSSQAINTWYRQHQKSGKFGAVENMSESEKEIRDLRKEVKRLRMENDILKQAALILSRKDV